MRAVYYFAPHRFAIEPGDRSAGTRSGFFATAKLHVIEADNACQTPFQRPIVVPSDIRPVVNA
jgi:hypothetical protein